MISKVVIADDHPIVLSGLGSLIGGDPAFTVVAQASNGIDALQLIKDLRPDLAVLDINMPGLSGTDVLLALTESKVATLVVILAASLEDSDIYDAVTRGAAGLLLKESAPQTLLDCLREATRGRRWLPAEVVDGPLARESRRREAWRQFSSALTERELEIARLASAGYLNKEVAFNLNLSEGTVKVHLHNIFRKLQIRSRSELFTLTAGLLNASTQEPPGNDDA